MRQISVAVIGCGIWGFNHARVYSGLDNVQLVKVVDVNPARARAAAEAFNAGSSLDPIEAFVDDEVDAVSICTPTVTHAQLAKEAILSGKHVLVEKPMTARLCEARELMELAEREDVVLAVGHVERFNPAVEETIRLVERGEVGQLLMAHAARLSRRPERHGDVGVVKDLAIHDVDIVTTVLGDLPRSVFSVCGSLSHGFEDYATIALIYDGDASGFVEANWLTPKKVRSLTVTGSEGVIRVEYLTQRVSVDSGDETTHSDNAYVEPLMLELRDFADAVLCGREPAVTGQSGYDALRICEAALRSSEIGGVVRLSDFG
ncbi:MAG TPA: Gfo/Idh/MocA family oxidoreductase [Candidatus Krumholzibacteriaceae bacterium]|nr:Gfo/Idh/MocA family oxidoreductase [Candidatus Krumholzibacteriaceae bacterium]